jgi:hypothetical protein
MKNAHPHNRLGFGLLFIGVVLALFSYYILATTWLTALGLAMVIMGFILLALSRSIPRLPPEYCRLLFRASTDTVSDLLEELGITNRAIYLPPKMTDGKLRALIPLDGSVNPKLPVRLPSGRLIVQYGPGPDDIGLLISTPGTRAMEMIDRTSEGISNDLEADLNTLFRGMLDVADRAQVTNHRDKLTVELINPIVEHEKSWASQSLGSPLAAIAAAAAAVALARPVSVAAEHGDDRAYYIEIEAMPCVSSTDTS